MKCPLEEVDAHTLAHRHAHTDAHIGELLIYSLPWWEQYSVPSVFCGSYTNDIHTDTRTHKMSSFMYSVLQYSKSLTYTQMHNYLWNIIDFLLESFAKENSIFKSPMLSLPAWRKDNIDRNIDLCMWCFSGVHCFLLYQTLTLRQLEHTVTDLDRCFVGKSLSWFNELVFYSDPIVGSLLRFAILLSFSASHALTKRGFFPQRISRFPNQSVGTSAVCHSSSLLPHILRLQRL